MGWCWRTPSPSYGLDSGPTELKSRLSNVWYIRTLSVYAKLCIFSILFAIVPEIHANGTTVSFDTRAIRLAGSFSSSYEGVVEVFLDGEWGAICDDDFGNDEADVVCRQLGYDNRAKVYYTSAAYKFDAPPYDAIFYDSLSCDGYELTLEDCAYSSRRDYTCSSGYDVAGVKCDDGTVSSGDGKGFNFTSLLIVFIAVSVVLISVVYARRHRQRRGLRCTGPPDQSQVQTVDNVQGTTVIPLPSTTSYPAPPPGPTQPESTQYPLAAGADLPPQYNAIVPPKGSQGMSYPPQANGAMYPPQGGTSYPPAQAYPASVPTAANPAYPPDNTASPAFPPSDYTPVTNDPTPSMPPPSYENVPKDSN